MPSVKIKTCVIEYRVHLITADSAVSSRRSIAAVQQILSTLTKASCSCMWKMRKTGNLKVTWTKIDKTQHPVLWRSIVGGLCSSENSRPRRRRSGEMRVPPRLAHLVPDAAWMYPAGQTQRRWKQTAPPVQWWDWKQPYSPMSPAHTTYSVRSHSSATGSTQL